MIFTTIAAYHQALASRTTTCVQTVQYYLHQIAEKQPLNAFAFVFEQEALERAAALDAARLAGAPLQPLHGVVMAIKDVICYKGHPVSAASAVLRNFTSMYSATAVERLLQAGAIIIGSCNCDEFAMGSTNENSVYGSVLNAADTSKVPGGSSGGSAVAVQAGMCMLSLGSDTGGSVRQPADFCGIIGIKPTYGRISRYGLIAYASSFDQIGVFGTTVVDVALALAIMSGADDYDSTALQQPLLPAMEDIPSQVKNAITPNGKKYRFAYFDTAIHHPSLDKEMATAIKNTIQQLQQQGHTVESVPFDLIDHIVPAYYVLTTAEASSNLSRYDGIRYGHHTTEPVADLNDYYKKNRSEGFGIEVKRRIMLGTFVLSAGYYDAYFGKAQQVRQLLVNTTRQLFEQYDALLMPTSPVTAFPLGEKMDDPVAMYIADIYTVFANLTGVPGISLPLYQHSNGMPFGLQVLTQCQQELLLLQISHMLMDQKNNL
jgi:aspartyl-tRNA(Asn)/glutamyl-tRNA(Gln) amidotransferase subunit A